jgi:hypothetical protein
MLVAVVLLWFAGTKVSPEGSPLKIQDPNRIQLPR